LEQGSKRGEADVYDTLESICHPANFRVYNMIPPNMVKGCEKFIDLTEGLEAKIRTGTRAGVEEEVCKRHCEDNGVTYTPPTVDNPQPGSKQKVAGRKADKKKRKAKKKKKKKEGGAKKAEL
jgi:hypothetical protein